MKIQDVLERNGNNDTAEQAAVMQRHNELLKEIKEKQMLKVRKKEADAKSEEKRNLLEEDVNTYTQSVERIKAAAIAAAVARGQDIAKAQEDFLMSKYPDMLSDATIIKNRLNNIIKQIQGTTTKEDAEKLLQNVDDKILNMPYKDDAHTLFDEAIKIINKK